MGRTGEPAASRRGVIPGMANARWLRLLLLAAICVPAVVRAQGSGVDPAARAALPEKLRQTGVLEVATALKWPPFAFTGEDGEPDGVDIRLVKGIAAKLGLTPKFNDLKFPGIVPGVLDWALRHRGG